MKKMKRKMMCVLMALGVLVAQGQAPDTTQTQTDTMALSLEQAQAYALQNSPVLKNANLDLDIAKKKIWETTAIGLPQVSGKLAASYQLKMSESVKQFSGLSSLGSWMYGVDQTLLNITKNEEAFGHVPAAEPSDPVSENDMKWGATFDLTVSQLLFSGGYLVGLQTTKVFKSLSEIAITKSKNDLVESVSNAYYLILVMQENKQLMDSIYAKTLKITAEMEAMHKSGFVEETTVDQMTLTSNTLKNTVLAMSNQIEVSKNLLRLQLGLEMTQQINLTDKLEPLVNQNINLQLMTSDYNVNSNSDYQLMETQVKLRQLNLKLQKSALLPDIAAFYQYDHNFNKNAMSFTPPHLIGVGMNIPIFGSGQKISRISQARMELTKAENQKYQVSLAMQLAYSDAKATYSNAINKMETNKESMDLARKIFERTAIKLKNGMASSLELTQAQTQYLQAQTTYYTTVIELVNAKNKLEKLSK